MNNNATTFTLLKSGAKIIFSDGTFLVGYPLSEYIGVGDSTTGANFGKWNLDAEGLENAQEDLKKYRKQNAVSC